ncbi:hypothetical protein PENTCL1PPCAC_12395, partial [Pristionchus entomophagus]
FFRRAEDDRVQQALGDPVHPVRGVDSPDCSLHLGVEGFAEHGGSSLLRRTVNVAGEELGVLVSAEVVQVVRLGEFRSSILERLHGLIMTRQLGVIFFLEFINQSFHHAEGKCILKIRRIAEAFLNPYRILVVLRIFRAGITRETTRISPFIPMSLSLSSSLNSHLAPLTSDFLSGSGNLSNMPACTKPNVKMVLPIKFRISSAAFASFTFDVTPDASSVTFLLSAGFVNATELDEDLVFFETTEYSKPDADL